MNRNTSKFPPHKSHLGFGLVEVMVAIAVSLFLLAGVAQVYLNNKQTYRSQDALARLQENGRFALNIITQDLRNAGFLGCAGNKTRLNNTLNNAGNFNWNFAVPIQGSEATSSTVWSPVLDTSISGASPSPLGGTDVITVRHTAGNPVSLSTAQTVTTPAGTADLSVNTGNGLSTNNIVVVSDCTDSAIFQITNATPSATGTLTHAAGSGSPGNANAGFGKNYPLSADVVPVMTTSYYIATDSATRPALWRLEPDTGAGSTPQEIAEGVQDFQVSYGVDADQDNIPDRYITANNVTFTTDNIVSIRVALLLATVDDYLAETPQSYTFNGTTITPTDRRLRRTFTETIGVRNKTL